MEKFECGSLASELLSDLKRTIQIQKWIIVAQAIALIILALIAK